MEKTKEDSLKKNVRLGLLIKSKKGYMYPKWLLPYCEDKFLGYIPK